MRTSGLLVSATPCADLARTEAGSAGGIAHLREGVTEFNALRALLRARCPGVGHDCTDAAAMVALCFAGGDVSRLVVFSFSYSGRPAGFVVALAEQSLLTARIGRIPIARRNGLRLRIPGDPALVWDERVVPFARALPDLVAVICSPREPVLVLQGAVAGGPLEQLAQAASQGRARFMRTAEESRERHWAVTELGFEKFFATFSAKSRESFRQSQRKLSKAMDGKVRLECYRRPDEVEKFFSIAEDISRQTYQWRELGLGMRRRDFVLSRLHAAARLGLMRCHILFCRDKPVAFSEGFAGGGVFLAFQTGFLPEMSKLSVGTVQTLEIMREILGAGGQRWCFDWQSGSDAYKRRMSNVTARERTLYLLPKGLRWKMFSTSLELAHACNAVGSRFLARARRWWARKPVLGAAAPALQAIDETSRMNF